MSQPTMSDLHVDALLSNLSLMYLQEDSAFVATRVFPNIPVEKRSDRYVIFSRADFNRNQMAIRAPGTESAGGGWNIDNTPTYSCDVFALHKDIDDQQRGNADAVFNLEAESTLYLSNQARIKREVDWASAFFAASTWTADWTGVAGPPSPTTGNAAQVLQWNDNNSNPIIDVRNLKRQVQTNGTKRPNKMVMGRAVFDVLCDHPDFVDRIKYGQTPGRPAQVTLDAMAALFELDEVLVMDALQNTGVEQAAPDSGGSAINLGESNAFIGGKHVLLVYTPSAPGLNTPGCGYSFSWTGYLGANSLGGRINSFYIPQIKSQRIEIEMAYTFKKVSADMGGFISGAVA